MSSNENVLGASPKAVAALLGQLNNLHEYQYQDDQELRTALSYHFSEILPPNQFVTANGGMELLDMICQAFVDPGDNCILCSPCFMAYASAIEKRDGHVIDVPLLRDQSGYFPGESSSFGIDVKGILQAITPRTKLVFLCSPNNPTGNIISEWDLEMLRKDLPDHVILVIDEVYHQYATHPGKARIMPLIACYGYPFIGLHSYSKAYGLAGLRLGYAFSTPKIAQSLRGAGRPFMVNSLSMAAGMAALDDQEHIIQTVAMATRGKEWLYTQFDRLGIRYWISQANFILFVAPYANQQLADDLLAGGIMVRTGDVFRAQGTIRVTVGSQGDNAAFISCLAICLLRHAEKEVAK